MTFQSPRNLSIYTRGSWEQLLSNIFLNYTSLEGFHQECLSGRGGGVQKGEGVGVLPQETF